MSDPTWRSWSGDVVVDPWQVVHPASEDELASTVATAAAEGRRVKAVGAGHSFTDIAATDGVQVRLDRWRGLEAVDPARGLATLRAGTRLSEIPELIGAHGLAMENLGDIDRQTLSGAIATGTHGTGDRFGGLATQVAALTLVLADGSVVRCAPNERPELFEVARLGLGAVGIVSTITLQAVPAFLLQAEERPARLTETLAAFLDLAASHDHVEFYWFPHTTRTLLKIDDRRPLHAGLEPLSPTRAWFDDELLANDLYGLLARSGHHVPALVPSMNRLVGRLLSGRRYRDASHRVFVSSRRVRFREMEYAVPRADVIDVVRAIKDAMDRGGWRISFPIEVRTAAADDVWLSTAHARPTAYVAVHRYWRDRPDPDPYLDAVERILVGAGGRPHWGKLHTLDAAALAARYPRFDDARRVRDDVDPERRFANSYLDRVLGG